MKFYIITILAWLVLSIFGLPRTENSPKTIDIDVISGKYQAKITINGNVVYNDTAAKNLTPEAALKKSGLIILVINQYNGEVLATRRFPTHFYAETVGIAPFLYSTEPGRIIVMAVFVEAGLNIARNVKHMFSKFGSYSVPNIKFRTYMASIFTLNGRIISEAFSPDGEENIGDFYSSTIYISSKVSLVPGDCWAEKSSKRKMFCQKYTGYGELCNCHGPEPPLFKAIPLKNTTLTGIPTAIIAKSRPASLYRCLITLFSQPGGDPSMTVVFMDGHTPEVEELLNMFNIRYIINDLSAIKMYGSGYRIGNNYKMTFNKIFQIFKDAPATFIIEEDLLLAPDFYSYFSQTYPVLLSDPSLILISAYNDLNPLHGSREKHKVIRYDNYPGYGWLLTRQLKEEMIPRWFNKTEEYDWDIYLRSVIYQGREVLAPVVSRAFHYSSTGAHIKSAFVQAHFAGHTVTNEEDIHLDNIDRLHLIEYEEDLLRTLMRDDLYFLNTTRHPCRKDFISRNFTAGPVVIFVYMESYMFGDAWMRVASCLGFWNMDNRGMHRGLWRIQYYQTDIIVIGYPFSEYSFLKPALIEPLPKFDPLDQRLVLKQLKDQENRFRFPVRDIETFAPLNLDPIVPEIKLVYI